MVSGILPIERVLAFQEPIQIVDARPRNDFDAGHIPGAIWLGWEEWCAVAPAEEDSILHEKGYWGVLRGAPAAWYEDRLANCGLRSRDPIAVYADGPRSRGREGRIAWMLLYLGAESVLLLDGGWEAWIRMGGEVERGTAKPPRGSFRVSLQSRRRCTLAEVTSWWEDPSGSLFVDTRSPAEFAGEMQEYLPRRGHIPGAVLVPFTSLFDADGRYVDRTSYLDALPPIVHACDNIVAYCEVGVRASLFALLHERYTGRIVSVCDGSLVEWSVQSDLPLQTDAAS